MSGKPIRTVLREGPCDGLSIPLPKPLSQMKDVVVASLLPFQDKEAWRLKFGVYGWNVRWGILDGIYGSFHRFYYLKTILASYDELSVVVEQIADEYKKSNQKG